MQFFSLLTAAFCVLHRDAYVHERRQLSPESQVARPAGYKAFDQGLGMRGEAVGLSAYCPAAAAAARRVCVRRAAIEMKWGRFSKD